MAASRSRMWRMTSLRRDLARLRNQRKRARFHLVRLHMQRSRYLFSRRNNGLLLIELVWLLFNLWDTTSWCPAHAGFDFHACYCFIIDFFGAPGGPNAKERARVLLEWWNTFVFSLLTSCPPLTRVSLGKYFRIVELMSTHRN